MSGGKSKYLAKILLDLTLGRTAYAAPASVFVALSLAVFDRTSTGDDLSEPIVSSYGRVEIVNLAAAWPTVSGVKSNADDIVFPDADDSWGTPKAAYVLDAASDGNVLYGCDIHGASAIAGGTSPGFTIAAGTLLFAVGDVIPPTTYGYGYGGYGTGSYGDPA